MYYIANRGDCLKSSFIYPFVCISEKNSCGKRGPRGSQTNLDGGHERPLSHREGPEWHSQLVPGLQGLRPPCLVLEPPRSTAPCSVSGPLPAGLAPASFRQVRAPTFLRGFPAAWRGPAVGFISHTSCPAPRSRCQPSTFWLPLVRNSSLKTTVSEPGTAVLGPVDELPGGHSWTLSLLPHVRSAD